MLMLMFMLMFAVQFEDLVEDAGAQLNLQATWSRLKWLRRDLTRSLSSRNGRMTLAWKFSRRRDSLQEVDIKSNKQLEVMEDGS